MRCESRCLRTLERELIAPGSAKTTLALLAVAVVPLLTAPLHAQTRTAAVVAHCLSVNLQRATATVLGFPVEVYFSTFDATAGLPLYDVFGGLAIFSGELSPVASRPGSYRTDYLIVLAGGVDSYGTAEIAFPVADADGNGAPDFLQAALGANVAFTGTTTRQSSSPNLTAPLSGRITRAAGSLQGEYTATAQDQYGSEVYTGTTYLLNVTGSVQYTRNPANEAVFAVSVSDPGGLVTTYTGRTPFTVVSSERLSFPQFELVPTNNRKITVRAFELARKGAKYVGAIELVDGGTATSWRDYGSWVMEVADTNDADRDGVPDLSDSTAAPPTIAVQPVNSAVSVGASVTLTVVATGAEPLTYQWKKDGQDIPGAKAATFSLGNVQTGNAGTYVVVVSNAAGSATSQPAVLVVNVPAAAPVVVIQPVGQAVAVGQSVTLRVVATGSAPLTYRWQKDGVDLPGRTGDTLVLANVTMADAGSYGAVVSNVAGQVNSDLAVVTVSGAPPTGLRFTGVRRRPDGVVELALAAKAGVRYLLEGSADLQSWRTVRSFTAASAEESLSEAAPGERQRFYRVREDTSGPVLPVIVRQPESQSVEVGGYVSLKVEVSGTGPFTFQWFKNGIPLGNQTAAELVILAAARTSAGIYTVVVSNAAGSVTSQPAEVTVDTDGGGA